MESEEDPAEAEFGSMFDSDERTFPEDVETLNGNGADSSHESLISDEGVMGAGDKDIFES